MDGALWELEVRWTHLTKLIDMGLNIITGSDSSWGNYKLGNTVYETEALVHAGMSPMRGIVSLTSDAAKSLDIDGVTGSLDPGKEADIVVIDGNPAEKEESRPCGTWLMCSWEAREWTGGRKAGCRA